MLEWYAWLSQLNAAVSDPLTAFSERLNIPLLTALLLGLLGSTAPCQLTTNASAMALVAQRLADPKGAWKTALAYTAGKVVVYTLAGTLILALGLQLDLATIPVAMGARKALGPLMLLIGLLLVGAFQLNVTLGQRVSRWLEGRVSHKGMK
ncbi:MAG: sulfite exporter TauE/SafE family protein, partial [Candidatus Entotheonellia bacterium]